MRRAGIAKTTAVIGGALLVAAGCSSTSTYSRTDTATTPQDKTHQEQLAEMSRQDAEAAEAGTEKPSIRRRPSSNRRTGQKVIDQPIRR